MKPTPYSIPINGLKPGLHNYSWDVDSEFLADHPYAIVKEAELKVNLVLEKRRETLYVLNFTYEGYEVLECDRCLDNFKYPISFEERYIVQLGGEKPEKEDDELLILPLDSQAIDVTQIIYEAIHIQVPIRKICTSTDKECNPTMLKYISSTDEDENNESGKGVDERWSALGGINLD